MKIAGLLGTVLFTGGLLLTPSLSVASPNIGGCGWGAKLMEGNEGIAPQVLAVTTNGTSGSQTFGITSGTSGCTQSGVVRSNWKTAMFIDGNMNKLARDMSTGQGEALESLASLLNVDSSDKAYFFDTVHGKFGDIFGKSSATSEDVRVSLAKVLSEDARLSRYAAQV